MSTPAPSYSSFYVKAWTLLSIALGLLFFALFCCCDDLLHAGGVTWNLLRWLARPFI